MIVFNVDSSVRLVNGEFKAAHGCAAAMGATIIYAIKSDEDEVLVLVCTPIPFEQLPPNQHDRLTARGFTNLQ